MNYNLNGFVASPEDKRDFVYSAYKAPVELPDKFFYDTLPTKDQSDFGSCVGFGSSSVKDRQERINHAGRGYVFSPSFIYSECKKIDGIPNTEGTYPRCAMEVLFKKGVCLESTMPYDAKQMKKAMPQATEEAYKEAERFKIKHYARVYTVEEIKQAIYNDSPVLAGVIVTTSFTKPENGGFIPMPEGYWLGGHAICLDGYDDTLVHRYSNGKTYKGFFRVVNSWGESYGDNGYGYLPYDFITFKTDLGISYFMEAWTSLDISTVPEPIYKLELQINDKIAIADNQEIELDQAPILDLDTSRSLVPLRQICELFGQRITWNSTNNSVGIGDNIKLWIDKNEALVNGEKVIIDQPPYVDATTNRTLVPVRFLSEVLGYKVQWYESESKIVISR